MFSRFSLFTIKLFIVLHKTPGSSGLNRMNSKVQVIHYACIINVAMMNKIVQEIWTHHELCVVTMVAKQTCASLNAQTYN